MIIVKEFATKFNVTIKTVGKDSGQSSEDQEDSPY